MKDVWVEEVKNTVSKNINKKKLLITISIVIASVIVISIIVVYNSNKIVRNWIDKYVFRKEVLQDKAITIDLKEDQNASVYAFNKYIGVLNKTKFEIYGNTGNKEKELEVQISNPIFNSANRFLAIAENKGQRFYLISDKDIAWDEKVDGDIAQIYTNKNGYVAVVIVNTSHKTAVKIFNPQGKPMFTTYLSSTRAVDVDISNDNKHLAIAEVDTSGSVIQSNIRILSIDKAETDPTNSLENTYKGETNKLITNIKYQDKNKLVCMYTDSIHEIENDKDIILIDNTNRKVMFQSVDLNNAVCSIEEKSSGLFTADSVVSIVNTENRLSRQYTADSVTKEIYTYGDIIALNLGTEIEFINRDGWLVKRYVAKQEITDIVVSDSIAGIIYRDTIEIINL